MQSLKEMWNGDKQKQVVLFSSTAIALYGYDQGMMSLINTNKNYLQTMNITESSPIVGVIVSVYYLGTAVGAVLGSWFADKKGRKPSITACLITAALGNLIMFVAGLGFQKHAIVVMFIGRVVMGLGVGGIDSVIPVYSSELAEDESRGKALAQEFQSNILGLNMAFGINLVADRVLGKSNEWAWRIPIILMQLYPIGLLALVNKLPESPRFYAMNNREDDAKQSLESIYGEGDDTKKQLDELMDSAKDDGGSTSYKEMLTPSNTLFHPSMITVMGQINQALTGYGAVSVYGPQIFELLGFPTDKAEYLTQGNYISYLLLMTLAWLLIDAVGRRSVMVWGSSTLTICFALLALFGGLVQQPSIPTLAAAIPGIVLLFIATGAFGIGWLVPPFLVPSEIYPTSARAKGAALSVVVWGFANFAVTLMTPILFNNLKYWLFVVFAGTNAFAGVWTYFYQPESGGRSFEENMEFFEAAKEEGSWRVGKVKKGEFKGMPKGDDDGERQPLLTRVRQQAE